MRQSSSSSATRASGRCCRIFTTSGSSASLPPRPSRPTSPAKSWRGSRSCTGRTSGWRLRRRRPKQSARGLLKERSDFLLCVPDDWIAVSEGGRLEIQVEQLAQRLERLFSVFDVLLGKKLQPFVRRVEQ